MKPSLFEKRALKGWPGRQPARPVRTMSALPLFATMLAAIAAPLTDGARAEGLAFLAGGKLQFGALTAEDNLLSDGEGTPGYTFFAETELEIEAKVVTSEALEIGAKIILDADAEVAEVNADETFIFVDGAFGRLELGRTDGAEDAMALGADTIAVGTGGIDGDAGNLGLTQITNSADAAKISYFTPRLGGVQVGASFTPDTADNEDSAGDVVEDQDEGEIEVFTDHVGLGLNYVGSLAGANLAVAAVGSFGNSVEPGLDNLNAVALGGTLRIDPVTLGVSFGRIDADIDAEFATLGTTMTLGKARAGLGYNYVDDQDSGITHVVVLSGDILLLDNVRLQADLSYADPEPQRSNIGSVLAIELEF